MNKEQIDGFFNLLQEKLEEVKEAKIILTGAAAGFLMGSGRPSLDIDFAIICEKRNSKQLEEAIQHVSAITGIAVNFSEDIDRWSQITYLDYKQHILTYKKFGEIKVFILSPAYWSIGKIARYLDPDIEDLVKVLKHESVPPLSLAQLWGKALAKSPRSTAAFTFKLHVEHFLHTYGKGIWGKRYNLKECLGEFWKAAGIKEK